MRFLLIFFVFFFSSCCLAFTIEPGRANPSKPILNLVFVPWHYQDTGQFSLDVDCLWERLTRTKPFDECIEQIAWWKIDISPEEEQTIFKRRSDFPYLAVHNDFLAEVKRHVQGRGEYKLIIIDKKRASSCAELSAIDKFSLIILGRARYNSPDSFAKGFLHELGHSLGLRDESLDSHAKLCPPGPPNCATTKEEAQEWWGDLVGQVRGVRYIGGCCGSRSYFRPTIASLMNDTEKARSFGPVNERYLRKALKELED